jgi:hypothetical protein
MNPVIYKKVAEVQCALLSRELPKSGFNKFNKFHYHELEDLLPPIIQECFKRDLMLFFNFTEDAGVLKIKDMNSEGVEMNVRVPMPPIAELKTMNLIQSEGAYITYLKRYLLLNTFLITEKDVVDSDGGKEPPKRPVKPKKPVKPKSKMRPVDPPVHEHPISKDPNDLWPKTDDPKSEVPKPVADALAKISAKGIPITQEALKNHIPWSSLDTGDRIKCTNYIQKARLEKGGF